MTANLSTPDQEDPMPCECIGWARVGMLMLSEHHPDCPRYDPEGDARKLIVPLLDAMIAWGAEEDGIPEEAWPAFERASLAIGRVPKP